MGKSRFKTPKVKSGDRISVPTVINYDSKPIIFSLEKLQLGTYCLSSLNEEHQAMFADSIFRRKSMLWKEVRNAPKHGLGTEKIDKGSISAPIPKFITDESESLLALRYHGKCPMVGYRLRDIFFVLWFDHNFSLYDHGS